MPAPVRFSRRSICPVANAMDLVGDKWTWLVVRDMLLLGKRRFGDLLRSDEGISSNILADRLRRLERSGIVTRRAYARRPVRYEYELTPKGAALFPVLRELVGWANRHIPGTAVAPAEWLERAAKKAAARAARISRRRDARGVRR